MCDSGRPVDYWSCHEAVLALAESMGRVPGRGVQVGKGGDCKDWGAVPVGCSAQTAHWGDFAPHYKTSGEVCDLGSGSYSLVCTSVPLTLTSHPPCTPAKKLHTVAYAFLTRGHMPLWPLWAAYFEGAGGAAVPIFHAQDLESHDRLRNLSAPFNGYVLPTDETVQGYPRFSWKMIKMMLHLYRAVARLTAPNGCEPQWVHLASERDVPVVPSPFVHLELASKPALSHISYNDEIEHSQWVTLWVPHAVQIAGTPAHEAFLERYWQPRFHNGAQDIKVEMPNGKGRWSHSAPDEIVIGWELRYREGGPRVSHTAGGARSSCGAGAPAQTLLPLTWLTPTCAHGGRLHISHVGQCTLPHC